MKEFLNWCNTWKQSNYKVLELQTYLQGIKFDFGFRFSIYPNDFYINLNLFYIFGIDIEFCRKVDHAGFYSHLTLFGLEIHLNRYDTRHWDEDSNNWKAYD